jgi:ElaA protein
MEWTLKSFNDLTNQEMHDIYRLRIDIFVVEQDCPYSEIDGKDPSCLHLFAAENQELAAYARIVPPGLSFEEASIGRIIVNEKFRKHKLGTELVAKAIEAAQDQWPEAGVQISAQAHLQKFYGTHGFVLNSEEYLEDNIPHVQMILK